VQRVKRFSIQPAVAAKPATRKQTDLDRFQKKLAPVFRPKAF
jgi:hypothetical protein